MIRLRCGGIWPSACRALPPIQLESQASLLFLVVIAGGVVDDIDVTVASILGSIGWMLPDGTAPTPWQAVGAARDTYEVLRRIGAITGELFSARPHTATPKASSLRGLR